LFDTLALGRIVVRTMRQSDKEALSKTIAFVVMPDHVHWLFSLGDNYPLSKVINLFKGRSARIVNQCHQRPVQVWQPAFHDHAVRDTESLSSIVRYIVMNPVRAKIVEKIGDYSLWDCVGMPLGKNILSDLLASVLSA
jgi:REP element-mobilizing transposase RayT